MARGDDGVAAAEQILSKGRRMRGVSDVMGCAPRFLDTAVASLCPVGAEEGLAVRRLEG